MPRTLILILTGAACTALLLGLSALAETRGLNSNARKAAEVSRPKTLELEVLDNQLLSVDTTFDFDEPAHRQGYLILKLASKTGTSTWNLNLLFGPRDDPERVLVCQFTGITLDGVYTFAYGFLVDPAPNLGIDNLCVYPLPGRFRVKLDQTGTGSHVVDLNWVLLGAE